ncbi:efflux RND transporter permease subunit [Permianibacter sp. IMCC34836]|uniref:efflux RND transporter permease subunit n=1 Tax=Permianibacter fluminis TaxID=2738515 RepID=UPI001556E98A|nr:efflux RND transporter permease subunit [Permianibacter fluminis]NQD35689.1 efflux RND transporter permease subunit [Permianibacter fluminis]
MVLSDLSIKRPVLATVLNLVLVLLGVIAYERLSVREYPNIDEPVVTVSTSYPGANAEIIETQVTKPLEDSLSGIEGIDFITSVNRAESSQISVRFKLGRDVDAATSDVRDRVARARGALPDEIEEPIVAKTEADAEPIIWIAFLSDRHNLLTITEIADTLIKDRLQTLTGVADVMVFGRRYAMRIWLQPERLAGYGVTAQDVEAALRAQNVEIPAGRVESQDAEFTVRAQTDLNTPDEFRNIVLKDEGGYLVRLGDVAHIELGPETERDYLRYRGNNAAALGVIKQSVANPLDISTAVRALLPEIQKALPEGMTAVIAYDSAIFIDNSIHAVYTTIGEAIVLVVLVIFVFLRSLRSTLIPLVTIPVSLIGAFALMALFGFTINTLTLLAMVLAIGLVVDDAIVVLENIQRHIENGMTPVAAAFRGSKEIGFAVIAMTLTLAAVFAPIAFSTGRTGKLFTEFALTLAGAVLVSGFIALTLTPMMCSKMLRSHQQHGQLYLRFERALHWLTSGYHGLLAHALRLRLVVVLLALALGGSAAFLYTTLKSELAPTEDRGFFLGFGMGPEGVTPDYVNKYAYQMEEQFKQLPEVKSWFTVVGWPTGTQTISFIMIADWKERQRGVTEITGQLGGALWMGVPGLMSFPVVPPSLGGDFIGKPVEVVIQTSGSYADLKQLVDTVTQKAQQNSGLANVDSDLRLNKPELQVQVNRDKAQLAGASVAQIGRTMETMLGGRKVTRFKIGAEQYDVWVQVERQDRANPDDLARLYVRTANNDMLPLSNFVEVTETVSPRELNHFNKLRSATISATLQGNYSLGEALQFFEQTIADVQDVRAQIDYAGNSREFKVSSGTIYTTFLLALIFIYLVLAAQFESFIDPFVILFSVPLAIAGALFALKVTGGTLNIYSQIGLITLVGLITKHGILIVEFSNQLRAEGRELYDAVTEAATLRLRPILMTTGAMVLGALPLATATGAGAESRHPIGWVIVGGMVIGTFFTLFVVPVMYTLLSPARAHKTQAEIAAAASN